ncbi:PD-(D/E)XK motif protein [Oricola sp.]|uniref:PD-(D/E)XK motif protein n=1 Tax=Oricola sp. TaxID=1979950 RepID=UPI00320BD334|nr:PD-(D/E)XK motif protein [Oricola sp.]
MIEEPADGWAALRKAGQGDGTLEVPSRTTGVETGFGPARYAVGPGGEPRLLIPFSSGSLRRDPGTASKLDVSVVRYQLSGRSAPFIDLTCIDRALDAVFAELVGEVLARLAAGAGPEDAAVGTISDFRELLVGVPEEEASKAAIIGLLGELYVLKRLCQQRPDAIAAWTGPFELRHDFRRGIDAFEVKSSARSDASTVTINGFDQLLPPAGGRLVLVHLRMEQGDKAELRVEALVKELLALGIDSDRLAKGLAEIGCLDPSHPSWNRVSFSLQGLDTYRVENGFPRIVKDLFSTGETPPGITKFSYEIDLAHAANCRMSSAEFDTCLKRFLS